MNWVIRHPVKAGRQRKLFRLQSHTWLSHRSRQPTSRLHLIVWKDWISWSKVWSEIEWTFSRLFRMISANSNSKYANLIERAKGKKYKISLNWRSGSQAASTCGNCTPMKTKVMSVLSINKRSYRISTRMTLIWLSKFKRGNRKECFTWNWRTEIHSKISTTSRKVFYKIAKMKRNPRKNLKNDRRKLITDLW